MKAFSTLFRVEFRLSLRDMNMPIFAVIMPVVVMLVVGMMFGDQPAYEGASYTFVAQSVGAVSAIGICAGGAMGLPLVVSNYRHRKILKRYFVTPVSVHTILAVQVAIYTVYALISAVLVFGVAALFFGWLYDRWDTKALVISTLLTAPFGFFVFLAPGQWALWVGASLWGIGMGAQESVLKAAVARLVPKARRSSGYGTFQTAFGVCLFLGSWFMGWLYERSLWEMVLFSVAAQVLAAILFLLSGRTSTGRLSAEEQ